MLIYFFREILGLDMFLFFKSNLIKWWATSAHYSSDPALAGSSTFAATNHGIRKKYESLSSKSLHLCASKLHIWLTISHICRWSYLSVHYQRPLINLFSQCETRVFWYFWRSGERLIFDYIGKTTTFRRITVRETVFSRHHGGKLRALLSYKGV